MKSSSCCTKGAGRPDSSNELCETAGASGARLGYDRRCTNQLRGIKNAEGQVQHRFQNSKPGETIGLDGNNYYLSFIYQGAAKNRTGDSLESALVMSVNAISLGYASGKGALEREGRQLQHEPQHF